MHLAHFVQRVPPALGGSEAYFARLARFCVENGDSVTTWTTTAIDLESFWQSGKRETQPSISITEPPENEGRGRETTRRYAPWRFPLRRYLLKAASLIPIPKWQAATLPCNPVCPAMWRDVGRFEGPLDAVHATAFPYAFPILCGLRLARRRKVPFFVTPFLHLGDPRDASNKTRRQYTSPPLRWLLHQADGIFVQTHLEKQAALDLGIPEAKVILQGLGVDSAECTGGNRERWRKDLGIAPHEVIIGHLANQSVEKGTVDLLKAVEAMRDVSVPFRIVLAGPEMHNFRTFWSDYTRKDIVVQLGVLTDEQKRDFYAGIDAFALPSRSDSFGLVLLEAWANGKTNLVYRSGGPSELIQHERDGLIAVDLPDLTKQLTRLISDTALRRTLGECGQSRLSGEFHWPDKLSIIRNALGEYGAGKHV
ncbi:MAG: glycosyltransferase family 4 protein [Gemmataceae bacterium]